MRRLPFGLILLTQVMLAGCSGNGVVKTINDADSLTLYEGLPHYPDEELKKGHAINLYGDFFYDERRTVDESDVAAIKALLADPKHFRAHDSTPKKCGGYHPDFCIEWVIDNKTYQAHICLGCREMKAYSNRLDVHCDMVREPYEELKEILTRYHKHLPVTARHP
jgi:hypothetical protein